MKGHNLQRLSKCPDEKKVMNPNRDISFSSWYDSASSESRKTVIDFLDNYEFDSKKKVEAIY